MVISSFINGLHPGVLYRKLAQSTLTTIVDLLQYIEYFQKREEAMQRKRKNDKKSDNKRDDKSKLSASAKKSSVHDRLTYNRGR